MSLIGIDVGTSAVKAVAFDEDGLELASAREPVLADHAAPGEWTLDPERIWTAVAAALAVLGATTRGDPPRAMAVSASGDEAFPVAGGAPLGPCLLSGDARGEDVEARTARRRSPREWYRRCGHVPERMDPINRLLWWREHQPDVLARADAFLGWHEFLTLRLCGRAVTDPGLATKWLACDIERRVWADDLLSEFGLDRDRLPAVCGWEEPVGVLAPRVAAKVGLPSGLAVCVGGYDASCAALGAGAAGAGTAGLACGTWEVVVAPTHHLDARLADAGASTLAYPAGHGLAAVAQSPNGSAVAAWAAAFLDVELEELEGLVERSAGRPSPVTAVPHLAGALCPWSGARDSRGALLELTLATTRADIAQALLESVAFEIVLTVEALATTTEVSVLRAAGGGTRSPWWMQLKADLTGVPIEVVGHAEPGAFGAALLAGAATGCFDSAGSAADHLTRVSRRYEPDGSRAARYADPLERHRRVVPALLAGAPA